jgi:hypothetical protein
MNKHIRHTQIQLDSAWSNRLHESCFELQFFWSPSMQPSLLSTGDNAILSDAEDILLE